MRASPASSLIQTTRVLLTLRQCPQAQWVEVEESETIIFFNLKMVVTVSQ